MATAGRKHHKPQPEKINATVDEKLALQEKANDNFEKNITQRIDNFKWHITAIVALFGAVITAISIAVTLFTTHKKKEIDQKLSDAEQAAGRVRELEFQAQQLVSDMNLRFQEQINQLSDKGKSLFDDIDKRIDGIVKVKLDELDAKGEAITNQAENQRKINELWNKALKAMKEEDFATACDYWSQIIELNTNDHNAFNNWGSALLKQASAKTGNEADKLFIEACEKLDKADKIKPNNSNTFFNWALTLTNWAMTKDGKEADKIFADACGKYDKATQLNPNDDEAFSNWGSTLVEWAKKKAGGEGEKFLHKACEKCNVAAIINPNLYNAFNNWGNALLQLAKIKNVDETESLFADACEKYDKAIQLKSNYYEAFNNWGCLLLDWAKTKSDPERTRLLEEAKEKCLNAESIKQGFGSYNMACAFALQGNKEKCREWLEKGQGHNTLETRKHAEKDTDLDSVRNEHWFKKIRWKNE